MLLGEEMVFAYLMYITEGYIFGGKYVTEIEMPAFCIWRNSLRLCCAIILQYWFYGKYENI